MTEVSPAPGICDGVTAVLLAGGRARRMNGQDKGLIELAGRPLAAHALERLRPQVAELIINANRNRARYEALGAPVLADTLQGYLGPLAGVLAALEAAAHPLVVSAPCDSPFVPRDLVERMRNGLAAERAEIAVATDGGRPQPVFLLLRTALAADLRQWLTGGGRKIDQWLGAHRTVDVPFADTPEAFININTEEERAAVEQKIRNGGQQA